MFDLCEGMSLVGPHMSTTRHNSSLMNSSLVSLDTSPALGEACQLGDVKTTAFLLANKADPNTRVRYDDHVLHKAAYGGNVSCVALLLDHKANVTPRDKLYVVRTAVMSGMCAVVRYLLTRWKMRPGLIMIPVISSTRPKCLQLLLDMRAQLNKRHLKAIAETTDNRYTNCNGVREIVRVLKHDGERQRRRYRRLLRTGVASHITACAPYCSAGFAKEISCMISRFLK